MGLAAWRSVPETHAGPIPGVAVHAGAPRAMRWSRRGQRRAARSTQLDLTHAKLAATRTQFLEPNGLGIAEKDVHS